MRRARETHSGAHAARQLHTLRHMTPSRSVGFVAVLAAIVMGLATLTHAQDLIGRWFSTTPGLTNGTATVTRDVPALDDDPAADDPDPWGFGDLRSLPRDAGGGFVLSPGAWSTTLETYCLYAGKPGPRVGDGYLYSPALTGTHAAIVTRVLERASTVPQVPQEDIQSLVWAILAHARYSSLPPGPRRAADALLTTQDIATIEANVKDRVSETVRNRLLPRLPQPLQTLLEAEARLRDLLATGASYAEQAATAVPDREPDPTPNDREIPTGRWSMTGSYLLRLQPEGYQKTRVDIVLPEATDVVKDDRGRITTLRGLDGFATEVEYDDQVAPLIIPGEPELRGFAFRRVTARLRVDGRDESVTINGEGWTFAGRMTGNGDIEAMVALDADVAVRAGGPSATLRHQARGSSSRYGDAASRYKDAKRQMDKYKAPSQKDVDNLADTGHYQKGVKAALGSSADAKATWLDNHFTRLARAAAYIACRLAGGCDPDEPQGKTFKPGGAATPGKNGSQLVGISGR